MDARRDASPRAMSTADDQTPHRVEIDYHSETTAVVAVVGEHDLSGGDALRQALDTAAARRTYVVVDFSRCTLLDSTGIAVLLDAQRQVRAAEGRFALVIPPGRGAVARVAELIRLADLVPISATLEDALEAPKPLDARPAEHGV
jgi:anti-anti-sigma factor